MYVKYCEFVLVHVLVPFLALLFVHRLAIYFGFYLVFASGATFGEYIRIIVMYVLILHCCNMLLFTYSAVLPFCVHF